MNGSPNKRAAVVIGVGASAGLTPLMSAAPGARAIGAWLERLDPGYDVTVITDEKSPVTRKQIFDALSDLLTPTRYELLLVHYIGHGMFHQRADVWMLSGLPEDPAECINLNASRDAAKFCGVQNVVFVSDACRSLPDKVGLAMSSPSSVFPFLEHIRSPTSRIDYFCATAEGLPAYEGEIDGRRQSFLTHALRSAYRTPRSDMLRELEYDGRSLRVVPNRVLEGFLQDTIDDALGKVDFTKTQHVEANVPSEDDVFIAPADPAAVTVAVAVAPPPAAWTGGPGTEPPAAASAPSVTADAQSMPGLFRRRPERIDDLTLIKGVGPTLQKRLNEMGVWRLEQIGEWDAPQRRWVGARLPAARGRIERDDWVGQARSLDVPARPPTLHRPAEVVRDALGRAAPVEDAAMSVALSEELQALMPDDRVNSFETQTGFALSGARIERIAVSRRLSSDARAEIAAEKAPGAALEVVRVYPSGETDQIAVALEDGRCLLLPVLRGYIGHVRMEAAGMAALSFVPSKHNWRMDGLTDRRRDVDRLRAAATLVLGERRFVVGDTARARELADTIRVGKGVDPVLGLYAAYAYSEAGEDDQVLDVSRYMRADIGADLFDVRLLSHRLWTDGAGPVVPDCPLLTQGWSLLGSRRATLPRTLAEVRHTLADSLWTTFGPGAAKVVFAAIEAGDL